MPIEAELLFTKKSRVKPSYTMQPMGQPSIRNGEFELKTVQIEDARAQIPAPALDGFGFELVADPVNVEVFADEAAVADRYYPAIERLIRQETGCRAVHIFDHTIRSSKPASGVRGTAGHTHNDYTESSFMQIWEGVRDEYESFFPFGRLMQLNAWRPINEPVLVCPLTVVDGASVREKDFIACDIVYPDRTGEIYELAHHKGQQWYYYPEMRRDEVLLIKGYDTCRDGRARYAPHTAFSHPCEKPDDPHRLSIEVRTIAIF